MLKHEKRQAIATQVTNATLVPRWLRPAAAAKYVGISRARFYELLSAGDIPSHRIGGCRLIDREALDAFIISHAG
jgi:excisionase family DNA binding protein